MALDDIVFPDGDPQNMVLTMNRGNGGVVSDVLTEGDSNPGMPVNELPVITATPSATVAYTWVS